MIKLTAASYNNQALPNPLSAVFGRDGGTFGRSEDNYFVLPDPRNLVSRIQASIKSDGLHHTITNLSQANPILLNGKEINFDCECAFDTGDEIQVGLYILRAEPHLATVNGTATSQHHWPAAAVQTPSIETHAVQPKTRPDFSQNPLPNLSSAGWPAPNLADLHKKKSEASALRSKHSGGATSIPPDAAGKRVPSPGSTDHLQPLPSNGDTEALMQAFLRGAGIPDISLNARLTPEFMEMLGKLLSTSIQGTVQLLTARASIKREVKADVTMVVVRNNNPLKFLSDSETVLTQMLRKRMPGFMGPAEAMQDAFADLHAHQSGMIAGMNGAISEVLQRFDPKALEKRIKAPNFLDSVLRLPRKARLWDQYDRMFDEINREVLRDYQKLFGKAFLTAYEKEIERARNEEQDG